MNEIVGGKNSVLEILKAGRRRVEKIFWARRERDPLFGKIQELAGAKKIPVDFSSPEALTKMTGSAEHQGIAASVSAFEYTPLDEVVAVVKKKDRGGAAAGGFLILLDEIQDPHNVGALIRTAHLCGASGLILLKHRQALITPAVCKAAAGATEYLPVVLETNLANVIRLLKEKGFWIFGAAIENSDAVESPESSQKSQSIFETQFQFPIALVLGSEGKGLRRLVRENCDALVSIPMEGKIDSFNVSVAGGILMGEILRRRLTK